MNLEHQWSVSFDEAGLRLDAFILKRLSEVDGLDLSRAAVQRWIDQGYVRVDAQPVTKGAKKIKAQSQVYLQMPTPKPSELEAVPMDLEILYEDASILVLNKSAGVVVHPGSGTHEPTLVEGLLAHCKDLRGVGDVLRPGIVHRLDKNTSGAMVVAKDDAAHRALSAQFADRVVEKSYWAWVYGGPEEQNLRIESFYGRHPTQRYKMTSKLTSGKVAISNVKVKMRGPWSSLLQIRIETGRTHQIRVHCAESGFPVVGDPSYGRPPKKLDPEFHKRIEALGRHALHAQHLSFAHPTSGERMHFEAPIPKDLYGLALEAVSEA